MLSQDSSESKIESCARKDGQIRDQLQVMHRRADGDMSHVQGEFWQQRLRIAVIAVGLDQGLNGEGMPPMSRAT